MPLLLGRLGRDQIGRRRLVHGNRVIIKVKLIEPHLQRQPLRKPVGRNDWRDMGSLPWQFLHSQYITFPVPGGFFPRGAALCTHVLQVVDRRGHSTVLSSCVAAPRSSGARFTRTLHVKQLVEMLRPVGGVLLLLKAIGAHIVALDTQRCRSPLQLAQAVCGL